MRVAASLKGEISIEKVLPEICSIFTEAALQLASRGEKNKVKNIGRLIFESNSDPGKLRGHVKDTGNCKRGRDGGRNEEPAGERFMKETMRNGNGSLRTGAVPYTKNVLSGLTETCGDESVTTGVLQLARCFG